MTAGVIASDIGAKSLCDMERYYGADSAYRPVADAIRRRMEVPLQVGARSFSNCDRACTVQLHAVPACKHPVLPCTCRMPGRVASLAVLPSDGAYAGQSHVLLAARQVHAA